GAWAAATASREDTAITGKLSAYARPWLTPHATRKPVNPPGPCPNATALICWRLISAWLSKDSTIGNKRSACSPLPSCSCTNNRSGALGETVNNATPQTCVDVSKIKICVVMNAFYCDERAVAQNKSLLHLFARLTKMYKATVNMAVQALLHLKNRNSMKLQMNVHRGINLNFRTKRFKCNISPPPCTSLSEPVTFSS